MDRILSPHIPSDLLTEPTLPTLPTPVGSPFITQLNQQFYVDNRNVDPLKAFVQSNQQCSTIFNQLTSAKHEIPGRCEELKQLNKKFEERAIRGALMTPEVQQIHDYAQQLQNYVFGLESKIGKLKLQLMSQIEMSQSLMGRAMQILVAEKLVDWLIKQKEISCGPRAAIKKHYDLLDVMDLEFEECGQQISLLLSIVGELHNIIDNTTPDLFGRLHKSRNDLIQNTRQFVWQSLVIAVQPPVVLVKCRGSDSHRSTRFPCKTELRLLGGEALGVRQQCSKVRVEIINEEMARKIQQDPCQSAAIEQSFHLIYNEAKFQVDPPTGLQSAPVCKASFDRIRLVENAVATKRSATENGFEEKKGTRRSKVSSLRYYLAYQIELTGHHYIEVSGYKLSLPVAALVHSSLEAEASLFWNRSFAEGTGILSVVPDNVSWERVRNALNLKFMSLIQEPQDVKELTVDPPEPRALSEENLEHLARRLCVVDGMVHKRNFFNKTVAHKENKVQDGSPVACVFYEWFYKCASMVNKYMQEQWNEGLITGFCSKEDSERNLRSVVQPTMLIRFSDMVIGYLKISCKLPDHRVVHYETEAEKMPIGTSIADAIRCNPTFAYIQNIFPNRRVSLLWQDRERVDETRGEIWNQAMPPGYFDTVYSLESKPVAAVDSS
jgi:hypothetical protein